MRCILLATLFSLGLAACGETAIEPQQFACQSPQTAQLSKQFASSLCVQNTVVTDLNATGPQATRPALEEATQALLSQASESTADPKAIRCRLLDGQTYCASTAIGPPTAPRQRIITTLFNRPRPSTRAMLPRQYWPFMAEGE
jgi:hypothetical protein